MPADSDTPWVRRGRARRARRAPSSPSSRDRRPVTSSKRSARPGGAGWTRKAALGRRHLVLALIAIVVIAVAFTAFDGMQAPGCRRSRRGSSRSPRVSSGYRTDPSNTYCNRFSAYWQVGADDCGNSNRDEQWCADFAAWVWRKAGVPFVYGFGPDDINAAAVSFYRWGVAHHAWHPSVPATSPKVATSPSTGSTSRRPPPQHVAVVVSYSPGARGPDVVNGDGDRTGFSVVETGTDQYKADLSGNGGQLAGYVSPPPPPHSHRK